MMEDVLDYEEKAIITKFQKWAFWCFILILLIFIFGFFFFPFNHDPNETEMDIVINIIDRQKLLIKIANVVLMIGVVFLGLSLKFKEPKRIRFWISTVGFFIFSIAHFF